MSASLYFMKMATLLFLKSCHSYFTCPVVTWQFLWAVTVTLIYTLLYICDLRKVSKCFFLHSLPFRAATPIVTTLQGLSTVIRIGACRLIFGWWPNWTPGSHVLIFILVLLVLQANFRILLLLQYYEAKQNVSVINLSWKFTEGFVRYTYTKRQLCIY